MEAILLCGRTRHRGRASEEKCGNHDPESDHRRSGNAWSTASRQRRPGGVPCHEAVIGALAEREARVEALSNRVAAAQRGPERICGRPCSALGRSLAWPSRRGRLWTKVGTEYVLHCSSANDASHTFFCRRRDAPYRAAGRGTGGTQEPQPCSSRLLWWVGWKPARFATSGTKYWTARGGRYPHSKEHPLADSGSSLAAAAECTGDNISKTCFPRPPLVTHCRSGDSAHRHTTLLNRARDTR